MSDLELHAGQPHDTVRVRLSGRASGASRLALRGATDSLNAVENLLRDAAEEAGQALNLPPKSLTLAVEDLIALASLALENGSFVWRIDLPLYANRPWSISAGPLEFGRRALEILAERLARVAELQGDRSSLGRGLEPRDVVVARDILNVVFAVGEGTVEWGFAWASLPDRDAPRIERVDFSTAGVAELEQLIYPQAVASETGIREIEQREMKLRGPVVNLTPDQARLAVTIDDADRTLLVRLVGSRRLREASEALASGAELEVEGVVELRPRLPRMLNPIRLQHVTSGGRDG